MENITIGQIAKFLELFCSIIGSMLFIMPLLFNNAKKHMKNNIENSLEPIKKEIRHIKKNSADGVKCSLRNDILFIYMMNKKEKALTIQEKQAINYSFELYNKLGGNSFIKDIVNEMNDWQTIN